MNIVDMMLGLVCKFLLTYYIIQDLHMSSPLDTLKMTALSNNRTIIVIFNEGIGRKYTVISEP